MKVLRYGDKGEEVKAVQQRLHTLGFRVPDITGVMDNDTVVAVIHFQRAAGIFNNGQVDDETYKALKII